MGAWTRLSYATFLVFWNFAAALTRPNLLIAVKDFHLEDVACTPNGECLIRQNDEVKWFHSNKVHDTDIQNATELVSLNGGGFVFTDTGAIHVLYNGNISQMSTHALVSPRRKRLHAFHHNHMRLLVELSENLYTCRVLLSRCSFIGSIKQRMIFNFENATYFLGTNGFLYKIDQILGSVIHGVTFVKRVGNFLLIRRNDSAVSVVYDTLDERFYDLPSVSNAVPHGQFGRNIVYSQARANFSQLLLLNIDSGKRAVVKHVDGRNILVFKESTVDPLLYISIDNDLNFATHDFGDTMIPLGQNGHIFKTQTLPWNPQLVFAEICTRHSSCGLYYTQNVFSIATSPMKLLLPVHGANILQCDNARIIVVYSQQDQTIRISTSDGQHWQPVLFHGYVIKSISCRTIDSILLVLLQGGSTFFKVHFVEEITATDSFAVFSPIDPLSCFRGVIHNWRIYGANSSTHRSVPHHFTTPCPCKLTDFECAPTFRRIHITSVELDSEHVNQFSCVRQKVEDCPLGKTISYSVGYVKLPDASCTGGPSLIQDVDYICNSHMIANRILISQHDTCRSLIVSIVNIDNPVPQKSRDNGCFSVLIGNTYFSAFHNIVRIQSGTSTIPHSLPSNITELLADTANQLVYILTSDNMLSVLSSTGASAVLGQLHIKNAPIDTTSHKDVTRDQYEFLGGYMYKRVDEAFFTKIYRCRHTGTSCTIILELVTTSRIHKFHVVDSFLYWIETSKLDKTGPSSTSLKYVSLLYTFEWHTEKMVLKTNLGVPAAGELLDFYIMGEDVILLYSKALRILKKDGTYSNLPIEPAQAASLQVMNSINAASVTHLCETNSSHLCIFSESQCHCFESKRSRCLGNLFACDTDTCISPEQICDGIHDCDSGEDELDCHCDFPCGSSPECVNSIQVCDEFEDCPNGEDEADCDKPLVVDTAKTKAPSDVSSDHHVYIVIILIILILLAVAIYVYLRYRRPALFIRPKSPPDNISGTVSISFSNLDDSAPLVL